MKSKFDGAWLRVAMIRYLVCIFALLFLGSGVAANPYDPECSCRLKGANQSEDWSEVVNATACTRDANETLNWCQIYVETLENQEQETEKLILRVVNASDFKAGTPNDLEKLIVGMFDSYLATLSPDDQARKDRSSIKNAMNIAHKYGSLCIRDFAEGKRGSSVGASLFKCNVGKRSGWLAFHFTVKNRIYSFLFAPTLSQ